MIHRLLAELHRTGGGLAPSQLAARLDVPPQLLELMLKQLCTAGYIEADNVAATTDCRPSNCHACPLGAGCADGGIGGRVWHLSETGRQAAEQLADSAVMGGTPQGERNEEPR